VLVLILEESQITLPELVEPVVLIHEDSLQSVLLGDALLELGDKHSLLGVLKAEVVKSCLVLAICAFAAIGRH